MSLLMDALRKAEEAKKLAAKQASLGTQLDTSAATKAAPAVENPIAEEMVLDADLMSSEPDPISTTDKLEEAFEFEIDESFGIDFDAPVDKETESAQQSAVEISQTQAELMTDAHEEEVERSIEFNTSGLSIVETKFPREREQEQALEMGKVKSELEALSTFTLADIHEPPESEAELERKVELESGAEIDSTHYLQKADMEKLVPQAIKNESERESSIDEKSAQSTPTPSPALERATESVARSPMRALRDEASSAAEEKRSVEAKDRKTGAAIESRKRESARAVFSAKSRVGESRGRLVAIIAASVLIPIAGLSFWVLDPLGMFSSGSQYNVPVASYDPDRSFTDVIEPGALTLNDEALPDVSESLESNEIDQVAVPEESPGLNTEMIASIDASLAADELLVAALQSDVADEIEALAIAAESPPMSVPAATAVVQDNPSADETNAPLPNVVNNAAGEATGAMRAEEIAAPTNTPINIVRSDGPQLDPQLIQAFSAYRGNDFLSARAHYQQALRNLPNNRDALLGLAAVALKMGDAISARSHYSKLLELDPRDALARVGLLGTVPTSDPTSLESELRSMFNDHPDVPQLAFALGNLQASQGRWTEAQQSYYGALLAAKAGGGGPVTPDYAFNLAVSLERLNQLRPAYGFYREALVQSQSIPPNFDVRILRERLDALERALP